MDENQKEEVYNYLNELRDSGKTNMFGAVPYLQKVFSFERQEASEWLSAWMKDF